MKAQADHGAQALAAGRDQYISYPPPTATVRDPQHEIRTTIAELKQRSYKTGEVRRSGIDVLNRIANDLLSPRDGFTFRAFVAANCGTNSDGIDERPIISDFLSVGVIERSPLGDGYVLSAFGNRVQNASRYDEALEVIRRHTRSGNAILEQCGRPDEAYHEAPMYFIHICIPKINEWFGGVRQDIDRLIPDYLDKFENIGNVTEGTAQKKAMIQQLERSLAKLSEISDDLRRIKGG